MAEGVRICLADKLASFSDKWQPKIVETIDDYEIKVVKVDGDFVWHEHADADELFIVIKGRLRMDFRDRQVTLGPGELIVVPRGTEHKPYAEDCEMILLERRGVPNTGDGPANDRTAQPMRI
ncbi:MAG: cupin domain-containing protein [Alphaproteobacteria bacterium]|nr:cupin domain-containing protein [Alphaproteobacteria bacterium]MCW5740024.1 cupin domain-containing protein [Alphaproteobacteria bacterium]